MTEDPLPVSPMSGGWPLLKSEKRFFVAGAGGWSTLKLTTAGAAPTVLVIFFASQPSPDGLG